MTISFTPDLSIAFKDDMSIQNACIKVSRQLIKDLSGYRLEPPFRIAISTYNGDMIGEKYLDNIFIEKFIIINDDMWNTKESFLKISNSTSNLVNLDYMLDFAADDLVNKAPDKQQIINNNTEQIKIENKEQYSNDLFSVMDLDYIDELNKFFTKKISLFREAMCENTSLINEKLKSNLERMKTIINSTIDNNFVTNNQKFLDLTENIVILQDLFISIKEHTNNDLNKKRKFLKGVLNQRSKYFISSFEGFKFSNEFLKNLILEKLKELQHKINSTIELVIY